MVTVKRCMPDSTRQLRKPSFGQNHLACTLQEEVDEHSRVEELKEKRRGWKEHIAAPDSFPCERCPHVCSSAIGLGSHLRAHERIAACMTGDTA